MQKIGVGDELKSMAMLRSPHGMSAWGSFASLSGRPLLAETVEKVENREAPKISRMSNVGDLSRSKAFQN